MKEELLRMFLQRLGCKVEGRTTKRGQPGKVWLNMCCPLAPYHPKHNYKEDRSPSAGAVSDTSGRASRYSCHACKSHGTITDLALSLKSFVNNPNIPYDQIAEEVIDAEFDGLGQVTWGQNLEALNPMPSPLIEEAYEGLWPNAWEVEAAYRYLNARGISQTTAEALELLFDPEKQRIMFPVRGEGGALYGWTGRTILPDHRPKVLDYEGLPKRHLILGQHRWRQGYPKIIVEGLFAYARMEELGVWEFADVGAILGSELTPEKVSIIRAADERTYMLVDADDAGDACIFGPIKDIIEGREEDEEDQIIRDNAKGALTLLKDYVPLFLPVYPEGKTDPDELTLEEVLEILEMTPRVGFEGLI